MKVNKALKPWNLTGNPGRPALPGDPGIPLMPAAPCLPESSKLLSIHWTQTLNSHGNAVCEENRMSSSEERKFLY